MKMETTADIMARRKTFLRKWRLRHRPVADSLEGSRRSVVHLHAPACQSREERQDQQRHRAAPPEFKRRIKTQTVLPSSDTAATLFWALMASGQILIRKVNGWTSLATSIAAHQPVALAA